MSLATDRTNPRRLLLQILFWGSIWLLVPLFFSNWEFLSRVMTRGLITFFGVAVIVFLNIRFLLPHFFFKKQYLLYVLLGLLGIALVTYGMELLDDWLLPSPPRRGGDGTEFRRTFRAYSPGLRWLGRAMPYLSAVLGSALFEITSFADRQEKETTRLRSEKLEAEMKFLRSQINPHFLFNALNNIYALTVIKSDDAPEQLLKLSNMLRYVLYDCNAERVPLRREIEYIRNFVELAKLKDSRGLNISTDIELDGANPAVAPMLFIPFIENALKHSRIEDLQKGWINIRLQADERHIHFTVDNSMPEKASPKDKVGGIGLRNVRRRLELLYPGRHRLTVTPAADRFSVDLRIDLA